MSIYNKNENSVVTNISEMGVKIYLYKHNTSLSNGRIIHSVMKVIA